MIEILFQTLQENFRLIGFYIIALVVIIIIHQVRNNKVSLLDIFIDKIQSRAVTWGKSRIKKRKFTKQTYLTGYDAIVLSILQSFKMTWLSVEFFHIFTGVASIVLLFLMLVFLGDLLLALSLTVSILASLFIMMYVYALKQEEQRSIHVMNFVDLCCSKMIDGVYVALKSNEPLAHESIRPAVRDFIESIEKYKVDVTVALANLNTELGPAFKKFYVNAKEFEEKGTMGMEMIFDDVITEHAKIKQAIIKKDDSFNAVQRQSIAIAGVLTVAIGGFAALPMASDMLFNSIFGKLILALCFLTYPVVIGGVKIMQLKFLNKLILE